MIDNLSWITKYKLKNKHNTSIEAIVLKNLAYPTLVTENIQYIKSSSIKILRFIFISFDKRKIKSAFIVTQSIIATKKYSIQYKKALKQILYY